MNQILQLQILQDKIQTRLGKSLTHPLQIHQGKSLTHPLQTHLGKSLTHLLQIHLDKSLIHQPLSLLLPMLENFYLDHLL
jgi:hypothetical protein